MGLFNGPAAQRVDGGCRGDGPCSLTSFIASARLQHAKGSALPWRPPTAAAILLGAASEKVLLGAASEKTSIGCRGNSWGGRSRGQKHSFLSPRASLRPA